MARERCVLPVRCKECGSIFDLWYDLQAQEQLRQMSFEHETVFLNKRVSKLLEQQAYCWDCRKKAVMEMTDNENAEEDIELSDYNLTDDFE